MNDDLLTALGRVTSVVDTRVSDCRYSFLLDGEHIRWSLAACR